jgi:hypothetical protein
LAGGILVVILPLAAYFADHPLEFYGRLSQVSVLRADWLNEQMASSGHGAVRVLLEHLSVTFRAFHAVPPAGGFFQPERPLLDPLSGALFVFGVGLALISSRQRGSFTLLTVLLAYLLAAGLTDDAPNDPRLVVTAPLVAVLVAIGLVRIAPLLAFGHPWTTVLLTSLAATFVATQGVQFYFLEYGSTPRYQHPNSVAATELAYYMREFPPGTRFLFLAKPRMSCTTHASVQFIAPRSTCIDAPPYGDGGELTMAPGTVVVALPERLREAEQLVANVGRFRVRGLLAEGADEPSAYALEPDGP